MKLRNGFVSNSSSSSFIILKKNVSKKQIDKIYNHIKIGADMEIDGSSESNKWFISENDEIIKGSVHMDNFDMDEFLTNIDIAGEDVKWGEY